MTTVSSARKIIPALNPLRKRRGTKGESPHPAPPSSGLRRRSGAGAWQRSTLLLGADVDGGAPRFEITRLSARTPHPPGFSEAVPPAKRVSAVPREDEAKLQERG